MIRLRS